MALLAPSHCAKTSADYFFPFGEEEDQQQMAAKLYDSLRACDKTDATIILATTTSTEGVGAAIMNRLYKAAGGKYMEVPGT